ncbi:MAG: hypothetical protein MUE95_15805 [Cyclobacteriaceae bacterium]|jgi:uncharacterized membrane protein|nr:hypothetical protein [Cyclobacteriaceae bacterium]
MNKVNASVTLTTVLFFIFTTLCVAPLGISLIFLNVFLFLLMGLLIWMVITVLKHGKPSAHTFDDRFYDDYEHRTGEWK